MRITQRQLRQIIREEFLREAAELADKDWDNIRMVTSYTDINRLPHDQQRIASVGLRSGLGHSGEASIRMVARVVYKIIDAFRDSQNYEQFYQECNSILKNETADLITYQLRVLLYQMKDQLISLVSRMAESIMQKYISVFGRARGSDRQMLEHVISYHWDDIKRWAFRAIPMEPAVKNMDQLLGRPIFPDAELLYTPIEEELQIIKLAKTVDELYETST